MTEEISDNNSDLIENRVRKFGTNDRKKARCNFRFNYQVVDLLNKAMLSTVESEKVLFLNQAQELVIHHDVLDNFLDGNSILSSLSKTD